MPTRSQIRLRSRRFRNIKCIPLISPPAGLEEIKIDTEFTTIIASGPNGTPAWKFLEENIPRENNTIICVNYSVTFWEIFKNEYIRPNIWVVTDKRAVVQVVDPEKTPWFPGALTRALQSKFTKVCFNMSVVQTIWDSHQIGGPYHTFVCKRLMRYPQDTVPALDVIRPGGTVTCSATQIWDKVASHPNRKLLICGADLSGDAYARGKNKMKKHGVVWSNSVNCLGGMIKHLNTKKEQVFVISKTKLTDFHKEIHFYPGSEEYLSVPAISQ